MQITHNTAKNGIEVSFPKKPDQSVIDDLKARGFRWSNFAKIWYTKYDPTLYNSLQSKYSSGDSVVDNSVDSNIADSIKNSIASNTKEQIPFVQHLAIFKHITSQMYSTYSYFIGTERIYENSDYKYKCFLDETNKNITVVLYVSTDYDNYTKKIILYDGFVIINYAEFTPLGKKVYSDETPKNAAKIKQIGVVMQYDGFLGLDWKDGIFAYSTNKITDSNLYANSYYSEFGNHKIQDEVVEKLKSQGFEVQKIKGTIVFSETPNSPKGKKLITKVFENLVPIDVPTTVAIPPKMQGKYFSSTSVKLNAEKFKDEVFLGKMEYREYVTWDYNDRKVYNHDGKFMACPYSFDFKWDMKHLQYEPTNQLTIAYSTYQFRYKKTVNKKYFSISLTKKDNDITNDIINVDELSDSNYKKIAEKFLKAAESLGKKIESVTKRLDTKITNTRKRQSEYSQAARERNNLVAYQKYYKALASAYAAKQVDDVLLDFKPTVANVNDFRDYTLMGWSEYGDSANNHKLVFEARERKTYEQIEKYEKHKEIYEALQKIVNLYSDENEEKKAKEFSLQAEIKLQENKLRNGKIDGFFPTPKTIAQRMVDYAEILPKNTILEPSAGIGHIAEAIKDKYPNNELFVCEKWEDMRSILALKGFNVIGNDTMKLTGQYDRILMNPPFENGLDIEHVRYCFDNLLKPGGRLVAIMSEGAFYRSYKKEQDFQSWYLEFKTREQKLDGNTFKGIEAFKTTGVHTRLIVLDKPSIAIEREKEKSFTPPQPPTEMPKVQFTQTELTEWATNIAAFSTISELERDLEDKTKNANTIEAMKLALKMLQKQDAKNTTTMENKENAKAMPAAKIKMPKPKNKQLQQSKLIKAQRQNAKKPLLLAPPSAATNNTYGKPDQEVIKSLLRSTANPIAKNAERSYEKIMTAHPEKYGMGATTGDKLLGGYEKANVYLVPIKDISINRALFQNREAAYSQRTVDNIVSAVQKKEFHLEVLDPLLLWKTKIDGKTVLYILAGHSRYQSFVELNKKKATYKNIDFSRIPARILDGTGTNGVDEKTAMYLARISNNLATPETLIERVEYYQDLLKNKVDEKTVTAEIKKLEDKNATTIISLVHLNPNGKTFNAYEQLGTGTGTNEAQVKNIAVMIGKMRQQNENLTNQHEDEIWEYLYTQKKYGTNSNQINTASELKDKIDRAAKNAKIDESPDAKLNIANLKEISDTEREYLKEKAAALSALNAAENERKEKQLKYSMDLAVEKKKLQNKKKEQGQTQTLTEQEESVFTEKYKKAMQSVWQKIDGLARAYRDVLLRSADVERLAKLQNALFS